MSLAKIFSTLAQSVAFDIGVGTRTGDNLQRAGELELVLLRVIAKHVQRCAMDHGANEAFTKPVKPRSGH